MLTLMVLAESGRKEGQLASLGAVFKGVFVLWIKHESSGEVENGGGVIAILLRGPWQSFCFSIFVVTGKNLPLKRNQHSTNATPPKYQC
jgi:hypothetical protein